MLQVTLLGTGSPSPSLRRHHPAAIVHWGDGASVLVDAGDGVVGQLLAAGIALRTVERVLLTHLHWDHVLGFPAFVWGSWTAGRTRLDVTGPSGTVDMHRRLVEEFYRGQAEWAIELGYNRAGWDDTVVRDAEHRWSCEISGCRVEAGAVVHPPMASLAWKFSFEGRSLVISGDTEIGRAHV